MLTILGITSGVGYLFTQAGFLDTNIVVIYLLAILITVWLTNSFMYGLIASVLATFAFNYLFADPFFAVSNDPNYIITFVMMAFIALVTSTLTSHAKRSAAEARDREMETNAIYQLTNQLSDANTIHDIASISVSAISEYFSCDVACLCFDENGKPEQTLTRQIWRNGRFTQEDEMIVELKLQIEEFKAGFNTGKIDHKFLDWPITGRENILGIICVPADTVKIISEAQMRLLRSMIKNTALAMDRFWSAEQRIKSREETIKERYRANLLRAISHDIRTPISGIIGTAEMMINMTKPGDPCRDLACGIQKDANWLHSLVENILNLTRLQDGQLILKKQPEAVEEVIAEAIGHISRRAPEYEITASVPDELVLVPMDAKLIVQTIINLLDNAMKHTEPDEDISVTVETDANGKNVLFVIKDSGSGIDENDLPHIFKMFYTKNTGYEGRGNGMGLGLVICETIVKAHGGGIEARNRTDGPGLEVVFTLPMEEDEN